MDTGIQSPQEAVREASDRHHGGAADRRAPVRLLVHDRDLQTLYTNAFRINSSADELFLDLGINTTIPAPRKSNDSDTTSAGSQVRFDISHRVVLNYYTAKRLVLVLSNLVRQHEQRFGELKLGFADRVAGDYSPPATD